MEELDLTSEPLYSLILSSNINTDDEQYPGVDGINAIEEEFFKTILKQISSEGQFLMDKEEIDQATSLQGRVLGIKGMFQMIPTAV